MDESNVHLKKALYCEKPNRDLRVKQDAGR